MYTSNQLLEALKARRVILADLIVDSYDWSDIRVRIVRRKNEDRDGEQVSRIEFSTFYNSDYQPVVETDFSFSPIVYPASDLSPYYTRQIHYLVNWLREGDSLGHSLSLTINYYCPRCGKRLTSLKSIIRGYGPECAK